MPPRIPGGVADAVVRSGVSRCRAPQASIARMASRPAASLDVSASLQLSTTATLGSTRHFTCSKCMSREQRQQQRRPSTFSTAPSTTSTPSSSFHASAATLAATESSYADELQRSTPPSDTSPVPQRRLPRWSATPAGMQAPFSVHKNDPANRFPVNEDAAVLDRAWVAVFGEGGADLCPAEVKWLAVTHKSFDQGRRGFNDRLCFLGKRIVDLQTSLAILAQGGVPEAEGGAADSLTSQGQQQQGKRQKAADNTDDYGRELFQHPVSRILPKLTADARSEHTSQRRLAVLARDFGLHTVVRWKPRSAADLQGSGYDVVTVQALYAMVGALALHRGGDVAVKAVRARILPRIGLDV